jgi:hypothetical protein
MESGDPRSRDGSDLTYSARALAHLSPRSATIAATTDRSRSSGEVDPPLLELPEISQLGKSLVLGFPVHGASPAFAVDPAKVDDTDPATIALTVINRADTLAATS